MKSKMNTREMTKTALCVALLCVASYISFPIPFTPIVITAQTLVVHLLALLLAPWYSLAAVGVYLLLGAIGLPVFAGGNAGMGVLFGPTGGYILGFLVSAPLVSLTKGKKVNLARYLVSTIAVGTVVIYLLGTVMFSIQQQISFVKALSLAVIPFIPGDVIKCVLASVIGMALNKAPGIKTVSAEN